MKSRSQDDPLWASAETSAACCFVQICLLSCHLLRKNGWILKKTLKEKVMRSNCRCLKREVAPPVSPVARSFEASEMPSVESFQSLVADPWRHAPQLCLCRDPQRLSLEALTGCFEDASHLSTSLQPPPCDSSGEVRLRSGCRVESQVKIDMGSISNRSGALAFPHDRHLQLVGH